MPLRVRRSKQQTAIKKIVKKAVKRTRLAKLWRKPIDSQVHRFKELLRKKIFINSATMQTPSPTDPANTNYRYLSGKLEDFINLTDTALALPTESNNPYLNNVKNGGLKTIFDRIKIDYIKFTFETPITETQQVNTTWPRGQLNLYTYKDPDGGQAPTSIYYVRERGNVRRTRMDGRRKNHVVICKPYTDLVTVDVAGNATVPYAKPLGWFDMQRLYLNTNVGVPRINLGDWFIECPTDNAGGALTPAVDICIDCQIKVYYSCKSQL